jgi:hypothetical protein
MHNLGWLDALGWWAGRGVGGAEAEPGRPVGGMRCARGAGVGRAATKGPDGFLYAGAAKQVLGKRTGYGGLAMEDGSYHNLAWCPCLRVWWTGLPQQQP